MTSKTFRDPDSSDGTMKRPKRRPEDAGDDIGRRAGRQDADQSPIQAFGEEGAGIAAKE